MSHAHADMRSFRMTLRSLKRDVGSLGVEAGCRSQLGAVQRWGNYGDRFYFLRFMRLSLVFRFESPQ